MSRIAHPALAAVLLATSLSASGAFAADHYLTIGGGNAPSHNQVSLEKNVQYFQHVLADMHLGDGSHEVYFSCGTEARRAVQLEADGDVPKLNRLLARIFGSADAQSMAYRIPEITGLTGSATRQSLTDWMSRIGSKLSDNDRLVIYFTGHGGAGNPARNTTLTLWNEDSMPVREFNRLLERLPPKVQVVLLMVQCHSGGFADVIFKDATVGSSASALSNRNRCGFFATTHDRLAAGCTPDINEENYHEFSTYFFEALSGRSRTGVKIEPPDFDHDGRVSFAEAQAYVQIHSDTIDIPVCTSETLLRAFSKTKLAGVADMVAAEAPFEQLADLATPAQRAALEGLSEQLAVGGGDRVEGVRKLAATFQRQKEQADRDSRRTNRDYNGARDRVASAVTSRWPELSAPWHPRVQAILRDDGDQIVRVIESHTAFRQLDQFGKKVDELEKQSLDAERKWVKCQRFLRLAEEIALAANLPKVADAQVVERYHEMLTAEAGILAASAAASK